jgi:serine/threonine protein kinase
MHAGVESRPTFSLAYSPPETIQRLTDGETTIVAEAATDVWAIGVIAFELCTRASAFPVMIWQHDSIADAALGKRPLPWESEVGTFRTIPELRALSSVVRACLARNAAARPSAADVVRTLSSLFDSQTTYAAG